MTQLLEKLFEQASQLPDEEQDELARRMLAELEAENRWAELLSTSKSKDALERMAGEALAAHRAGRTKPLNPFNAHLQNPSSS